MLYNLFYVYYTPRSPIEYQLFLRIKKIKMSNFVYNSTKTVFCNPFLCDKCEYMVFIMPHICTVTINKNAEEEEDNNFIDEIIEEENKRDELAEKEHNYDDFELEAFEAQTQLIINNPIRNPEPIFVKQPVEQIKPQKKSEFKLECENKSKLETKSKPSRRTNNHINLR
jgi:hypothetical protein